MRNITPTLQGKSYSIWKLVANYLRLPLNESGEPEEEPGLRLVTIIASWSMIESFVRECLTEQILRRYREIEKPELWKYQLSCCQRIKNVFKTEQKVREDREKLELKIKTKFANYVSNDKRVAWTQLKTISKQIGYDVKGIPNENWSFLINLYNLRNGLVHGKDVKILQGNLYGVEDEISDYYEKSIDYLNNKKVISKEKLVNTKDINVLLNKDTTDYIISESFNLMDAIKKIYHNTMTANQWTNPLSNE